MGRPSYSYEILVELQKNYDDGVKDIFECLSVLYSLLREDKLYCNHDASQYSCHSREGYLNYSEIFR